jgi:hypothetical protein
VPDEFIFQAPPRELAMKCVRMLFDQSRPHDFGSALTALYDTEAHLLALLMGCGLPAEQIFDDAFGPGTYALLHAQESAEEGR